MRQAPFVSRLLAVVIAVAMVTFAAISRAEEIGAPVGGKPLVVPNGRVACSIEGGWTYGSDHHSIKPPTLDAAIGQSVDVVVAPNDSACASSSEHLRLVTTGPWPTFDAGSVLALVDEARLQAKGKHLRGVRLAWTGPSAQQGDDVCVEPRQDAGAERCAWSIGSGLSADAMALSIVWFPAGASAAADEVLFDADGARATVDARRLPVSRVAIASVLRSNATLDAALGAASLALRHPEAVLGADCAPAACVVDGTNLIVSNVAATVSALPIRFRLATKVVLRSSDVLDSSPSVRVPVMRCPIAVVSGALLRDVEQQTVVVSVEGRCAGELPHLRFLAGEVPAVVERTLAGGALTFVFLRVGHFDAAELSITAVREEGAAFVVAQTLAHAQAAPTVRAALQIEGGPLVDFVPTNVDVNVQLVASSWDGGASIAALDGAYVVSRVSGRTRLHAINTGGSISLRVVLSRTLPAPVGEVEITRVLDPTSRAMRQVNLPAPLVGGAKGAIAEVVCDDGDGAKVVAPGAVLHVPFAHHDSCRLVLHRERLDPELGTQKLELAIDVTRIDGAPRPEARVDRIVTIEHGQTPRLLWLHGAEARFDRYSVRLAHVSDDRHYDVPTDDAGLASAQWTVITGKSAARLYATTAIPTGMYRVADADHSGILTLNFGVIARLTWLDALGHEGIVALEGGVMAVGLANDTSPSGRSLTQIATVTGVGLSVPIANRGLATEAAINLHGWFEYEPSRAPSSEAGSPFGFVFGPSISIGNLGADL